MKVAVIGSRTITDDKFILSVLEQLNEVSCVISGGAKGVDTIAEKWALSKGIVTDIIKPNYALFENKRVAPLARNEDIILRSDLVVAFWDGESKGTAHAIKFAKKHNKPIKMFTLRG